MFDTVKNKFKTLPFAQRWLEEQFSNSNTILRKLSFLGLLKHYPQLIDAKKGISTLKVKNYGEAFNLCDIEPFRHQPIAAGWLWSGFLVKDDVIATAAHCVNERNVTDLRILFGYKMVDSTTPVTMFSNDNIYHGCNRYCQSRLRH